MSGSYTLLTQKLSKLRDVDRVLDLSKSTLQLEVILLLASTRGLTAVEIARRLTQRRKAVTDALRKLKLKELVYEEEVNGDRLYKLSSDGERCLHNLMDAADLKRPEEQVNSAFNPMEGKGLILRNLALAFYVHECLVALGTSRKKELPLEELARLVSLSQQRLQSYLDLFSEEGARLFRKYYVPTTWSKILNKLGLKRRATKTVYTLTSQALQIFYKLPVYVKTKPSITFSLLRPLIGSGHPREVLRRLLKLLVGGNFLALLLCLMVQNVYPTLLVCWLALSTVIGGIVLLDFYLFNRI